jgi:hypothetical protein
MHSTNTISDHVSSYQLSEDISQSSFPASTTNPRRQHPNNSKQTRVALKDFLGTDTYSTLVLAKETFTATAFSAGLFFRHRSSPHTRLFRMMARDLITQAAYEKQCKSFDFYYHYHCTYTIIFSQHNRGR